MRDLHYYLENPFDDKSISIGQLLSFTTDHVQRLTANISGWAATRIGVTTTALTTVQNTFSEDETKLGLRKARKLAKNNYRDALSKSIGKIAVAVEGKFGEGSPEFVECFPHGRAEFGNCADDKLAGELQSLINGVHNHVAVLGAAVETDATALLTGWNAVFAGSEASTGAKTATIAAKNAARQALQLELFKTLLTIAQNFPRQPEQLDLYMQISLLKDYPAPPAPPAPTPTPPAP